MQEPQLSQQLDAVLNLDYVGGVDIYVNWSAIEPAEGTFSWRIFDTVLARCAAHGKTAAFGIMTANFTPDWVKKKSAQFTFQHYHPEIGWRTSPVPWDAHYQSALAGLVKAFAQKYDGNSNLYYVVINGPSTLFGVEMCWPMKPSSMTPEQENKLNFSLEKYEEGWKGGVDLYLANFHRTPLSLALNNEVDYPGVAHARGEEVTKVTENVRDYAMQRYAQTRGAGSKMILQLLGLTPDNRNYFAGPATIPTNLNPYARLLWDVRDKTILGLESAQIWNRPNMHNKEPFPASAMVQLFNNGLSYSPAFIKIKTPDLINDDGTPFQPYVAVMQAAGKAFQNHETSLPPGTAATSAP